MGSNLSVWFSSLVDVGRVCCHVTTAIWLSVVVLVSPRALITKRRVVFRGRLGRRGCPGFAPHGPETLESCLDIPSMASEVPNQGLSVLVPFDRPCEVGLNVPLLMLACQ